MFYENPSGGRGVVPCGRTDRHDEVNSHFSQFWECAFEIYKVMFRKKLLKINYFLRKFKVSHCVQSNYLLTYFLTSWCRVLLEKLTGLQLVKKFPAFHGTRNFITALTSVRHLSLSWASPIQSIHPHPISWRSILILSTHLRLGLPSGLFPSGFPSKNLFKAHET